MLADFWMCNGCGAMRPAGIVSPQLTRPRPPHGWISAYRNDSATAGPLEFCTLACLVEYGQKHGWNDEVGAKGSGEENREVQDNSG
jgi:hypothetical protein